MTVFLFYSDSFIIMIMKKITIMIVIMINFVNLSNVFTSTEPTEDTQIAID